MIAKALAEEVLAVAMSGGADFVELYGEITRNNSINMVVQALQIREQGK